MTSAASGQRAMRERGLGFALLVVLIAINLRAFLTSTSPLLGDIRAATGLSLQSASMLTTLPMVAMGLMSLLSVTLTGLLGARAGVLFGLAAIALACVSRLFAQSTALLLGSAALAGVGAGLVQAQMPAVVKRAYPRRTGMAMGLYSAALMGGGGLGAALAPWLVQVGGDWRDGLAVWALPALAAGLAWACARADAPGKVHAKGTATHTDWRACFRNRRAWTLAIYFGLINGGYTSLVAWLSQFYAAQGWDSKRTGSLLALMTAAQLFSALVVPVLARGRRDLRPWLLAMLALQIVGFAMLTLHAPQPVLVIGLLGFGLGGAFALCMTLAIDHLPHPEHAGALAAFMQGIGFAVAALAPLAASVVHRYGGTFDLAWACLGCVAVLMLPVTWRFNPDSYAQAVGGLFGHRAEVARPAQLSRDAVASG